jgi:type I restriction enzyme S subunit
MKDWRKSTLGELVTEGSANYQTGPFGTVLKASEFSKEGVPLISVGEIREGYIQILSSTPRVCERITTKLPKYILEEEDIVFGRKGAINRNAIIQKEQAGWFLGSDGIRLRLSDEHSSSFFSYQLRTSSIQEWLMNNGTGAIMPGLNQKILDRLPVYIPKLHIQQKIAKVLSTLDAKIELNNRINAELEGMAKLLYDYWFVQFDFPMTAAQAATLGRPDLEGQPYKSSGGKTVFNPTLKREIPDGWEAGTLGNISSMTRGVTYNKDDVRNALDSNVTPILRATNVTGATIDINNMVYVPAELVSGNQIMSTNDILIVMSSGSKDHIGKNAPYFFEQKVGFGAFCAKITPIQSHVCLVKTCMQSDHFKGHIRNVCLGTNINNLTRGHISDYSIALPSSAILDQFEQQVRSSLEQTANNQKQNQELTDLRDWLLPMLMNGQLTVQ